MSACCFSVSLKLSDEFDVIGGARWSLGNYEGWTALRERTLAQLLRQKQMRPGPATQAALLSRTF
jgi:hypothetical protein